jgi:hypothetical protein
MQIYNFALAEKRAKIMKRLALIFLLLMAVIPLAVQGQVNQVQVKERDTLKMTRDSLIHMVRVKDSLLILARRDSIAMAHLIDNLEFNRDSLNGRLNDYFFKEKEDSALRMDQYFRNREFNRKSKYSLIEGIDGIDEDSVKASLHDVIGLVFDDTAYSPKPKLLKYSMDRLLGHLDNDSVHFNIINAKKDTIPFILKEGRIDSIAFYLMNSTNDSARVFIRSLDKNHVYMWVGDDLMLKTMLKKQGAPVTIPVNWYGKMKYRIPRRPVPALPPKLWNTGAEFNLLANQAAFANYVKGGTSYIAFTTDIKGRANYAHGNIKWDNSFWFIYGVQKTELLSLRKSQDRIEIRSSLSHKAFKNFDYSAGAFFLTQGFKGYNYPNDSVPVSKFFAPATLQINTGMDYRPNANLKINISPASVKMTMILDTLTIDQTKYGLKHGQKVRTELGAQVYVRHASVILKNVNMVNEVILYSNYMYHPEKVDVDWRLGLDLKVNKYITTSIRTNLIYDDDMIIPLYKIQDGKKVKVGEGKRVQFMETLGVGFKYNLTSIQ